MARRRKGQTIEASLSELESIVTTLERGDLSLDEALTHFEKGISLTRESRMMLAQAEQKIIQLTEEQGQVKETPLEIDEDKA